MKKRILSMILAIAMVVSLFAGISLVASAEGAYVKTTSLAVGDTVIFVCEGASKELGSINTNGTNYGIGDDTDLTVFAGTMPFEIVAGANEGTYAFKNSDSYLNWVDGSKNSLSLNAELTANSSWTVSFDEAGNATITNAYNTARVIWWNVSAPRFTTYEGKTANNSYYNVQLYKLDSNGCSHANATSETTTAASCEIEGVATWTCPDCEATWTSSIDALGHSYGEGEVTTPAGCETEGLLTYTCSVCSGTKTETIDALGHDYADGICTLCGAEGEASAYQKVTTLTVGDQVYLVSEKAEMELGAFAGTSTKFGSGSAFVNGAPAGVVAIEIVAGAAEGTYGFKIGETYLVWTSGNSLYESATLDSNSSWTVSFDENGNAVIANAADANRVLWWNNQNPRFACYSGKSAGASYYNVQFYALSDGSCAHGNASSEITTAATCTEAGVMTWTCECGETWTTTIDPTGHSFSISIVDGNVAQVCSVCGTSESFTLNTIAEAKAYTDAEVVYNLKGVVTYVSGRTVYIEDENDGLCVYFATTVDTSTLNLGDEIFVSGPMTVYSELLELNNPTEYHVLSTGKTLPENTTVTLADLLADTENSYLGERVTISGLTIGAINTSGSTTLTDASGNSIALYRVGTLAENVTEGDTVTVTAIVSTHKGYQLIVNPGTSTTDVVVTSEGEADEIATVTIAEAKAGTNGTVYQVEGVVTYMTADGKTIYIQDATGGIALYLNSAPAEALCAIGDKVRASGSWKNYRGLIELSGIDPTAEGAITILASEQTVDAQEVTIADLNADSTNEYLAEKVTLKNVAITKVASNGTVTLKQGTETIIIYKAPALAELCVAGAMINVEAVVSCFDSYQLVITDASAVTYIGACAHENTTVIEGTPATCTSTGLTDGATCDLCEQVAVTQEIIPELGHSYKYTNNGDGTHTAACAACGDSFTKDCGYENGVCTDCGAKEPSSEPTVVSGIRISHSLNLASDITMNYVVAASALADYDSFYMECLVPQYTDNVQTGTVSYTLQPTLNGNYYYFVLTGVTALMMNDMVESTLYLTKGEENFKTEVDVYSVGTYAYSQLNKANASDKLKALCADLLRYGAAAQIYKVYRTDALVDAAMTEEMKAYQSDIDAVTFGNTKYDLTDCENASVTWLGRTLMLDSKVTLKYVFNLTNFTGNKEDLNIRLSYVNMYGVEKTVVLTELEEYIAANNLYSFSFDGLEAAELRIPLTAAVYEGDTQVSNSCVFSIDTYGNGKTGTLLDLCKALMAYSDTALAFFTK